MAKVLSSCFPWKKKSKNSLENPRQNKNSIVYVTKAPDLSDVFYNYQGRKTREYNDFYNRASADFGQDSNYSPRRCSSPQERRVRSYPASPERSILKKRAETDYLSDHYSAPVSRGSPYKRDAPMIYIANAPQTSSQFNPDKEGSKEPFPYDISVSLPRRSSMFYGVKYANDMNENPRYTAEKPIEDINIPDFSQEQDGSGKAVKGEKHVSIVRPEDNNEIPSDHSDNVPQAQVVKKTVVRFRPSSSSSTAPPSENVKFMPLQKQPKPSTQGKYVHKIPMKHSKLSADLKTIDGRKFMPVKESEDKLRSSIAQAKLRESQDARTSVIGAPPMRHSSVARDDRFPQPEEETVIYPVHTVPVRKSVLRSSGVRRPSILERQSIVRRESVGKRKSRASWQQSVELQETDQDQNFPFRQEEAPMVYAVPIIPTRGRSKSVLQQSVKSLTSKNPTDSSGVHRKNIRYSMDTDVFAAEVRRRSVAQERPGYVNMEKGQTVLVSEVLNPITSLFITDLKDPVPKDPLTKPKEANVWVQPRPQRQSFQRKPLLKQSKPSPVHVVYQERPTKERTVQRRQSRSHQTYSRDDSSSSEDSLEMDRGKYKHGRRQYHQVYAAQMPEVMLPDITAGKGKNPSFQKKGKPIETDLQPSTSKDYCGLTMDAPVNSTAPMDTQVKMVSSEQQTDVEEETDLVCYPSEQFLKSAALSASEPGSKLRWRIIIKRGEEK